MSTDSSTFHGLLAIGVFVLWGLGLGFGHNKIAGFARKLPNVQKKGVLGVVLYFLGLVYWAVGGFVVLPFLWWDWCVFLYPKPKGKLMNEVLHNLMLIARLLFMIAHTIILVFSAMSAYFLLTQADDPLSVLVIIVLFLLTDLILVYIWQWILSNVYGEREVSQA